MRVCAPSLRYSRRMGFESFTDEIMERARADLLSPTPVHRMSPNPDLAAMLHGPGKGDSLAMAAAALYDVRRVINWPFSCLLEARAKWIRYTEDPPERWSPKVRVTGAAGQAHKPFAEFVLFAGSLANELAAASLFLDGRKNPVPDDKPYPTPNTVIRDLSDDNLRSLAEVVTNLPAWKKLIGAPLSYRNRLVHRDMPRLVENEPGAGYARQPVWETGEDGGSTLALRVRSDPGEYSIQELIAQGIELWNALVRWAHATFDILVDRWLEHPHAKAWDRPGPPILHSEYVKGDLTPPAPHVGIEIGSGKTEGDGQPDREDP